MPIPTYVITELPPNVPPDPPPPQYKSWANDINNVGNAAGFAGTAAVWEGTTPHLLPSRPKSEGNAINDAGEVVGQLSYGPGEHAFYYNGGGQIQDLTQLLG